MRVLRFLSLLVLVSLSPRLLAWGEEGHRIVCSIAVELLSPEEQEKVNELVAAYRPPKGALPIRPRVGP